MEARCVQSECMQAVLHGVRVQREGPYAVLQRLREAGEEVMSGEDVREVADFRLAETRTERIVNVSIVLAVVVVICGCLFVGWDVAQANNQKSTQTQLVCIEAGGTWVGVGSTCVQATVAVAR